MNRAAKRLLLSSLALIAASALAACSSVSRAQLPPQSGPAAAKSAAAQGSGPVFQAFVAGQTPGLPASAAPWDIAPDGTSGMWFTDPQTPAIGTITPAGTVREFTAGLPAGSKPYAIVGARGGSAWFTDGGTASVGRIAPGGAITEFGLPRLAGTFPADLTIAPDGSVWFMSVGPTSYLARVGLDGKISASPLPAGLSPDGSLTSDRNGNLWFLATNASGNATVVQRLPGGKLVHHFSGLLPAFEPCCPNLAPKRMTIGPDGNLWFTTLDYTRPNNGNNVIAVLSASGISFFPVPNGPITYPTYPSGITVRGGKVWFSGDDPFQLNGGLWSMDAGGNATPYAIPYNPAGLASGPGGSLWMTSSFGGAAGAIVEATFP